MTDTAALLSEAEAFHDEDLRQEYLTLRLEGLDPDAAADKARATTARRLRTGTGMDQARLRADFARDPLDLLPSMTTDHRTDEEREEAWARSEVMAAEAARRLGHLSEKQRSVLMEVYGLDGREPCSHAEAARRLGMTPERVKWTVENARRAPERATFTIDPEDLRALKPRDALVLDACFGLSGRAPMSAYEAARHLQTSPSTVERIVRRHRHLLKVTGS